MAEGRRPLTGAHPRFAVFSPDELPPRLSRRQFCRRLQAYRAYPVVQVLAPERHTFLLLGYACRRVVQVLAPERHAVLLLGYACRRGPIRSQQRGGAENRRVP